MFQSNYHLFPSRGKSGSSVRVLDSNFSNYLLFIKLHDTNTMYSAYHHFHEVGHGFFVFVELVTTGAAVGVGVVVGITVGSGTTLVLLAVAVGLGPPGKPPGPPGPPGGINPVGNPGGKLAPGGKPVSHSGGIEKFPGSPGGNPPPPPIISLMS